MKITLLFLSMIAALSTEAQQWLPGTATSTDFISRTGRVAIGTATQANYTLSLYGSTTYVPLHVFKPGTSAGQEVQLSTFSAPGTSGTTVFNVGALYAKTNGANSLDSYIAFRPINTSGSGNAEGLTIKSGGALAIGTSKNISTGFKLLINGSSTAIPLRLFKEGAAAGERVELLRLTAPGSSASSMSDVAAFFAKTDGTISSAGSVLSICPINSSGVGFADGINIKAGGNVGIGTASTDAKLTVAGDIHSREVRVTVNAGADYVFEKNYNLLPLVQLEKYINLHKHLPEVAPAHEMEQNGLNLSEMNILLLKKIEELTLYLLEQNKVNQEQTRIMEAQTQEIKNLRALVGR